MVITKIASRNIVFKAVKMSETAFETQAAFVTRGVGEALSSEHESLEDLGHNAHLYILNHEAAQNEFKIHV